ncbi:TIGR02594 family protein [Candidatus Magnetaquicoccus inordinatus]|uniref:NlpC/P60 family protein n=1 Tax=Candidatus Magnetaquicoccus inordinatus TaxID=2496818 RepID=UPI00102CD248|nr:TIGR02594 family protein [Candidatus Magnetaquicoccus inordinatus]
MQNLMLGAQGEAVRTLQELLNKKSSPSPHLQVDGDFGENTEDAVVAFQAAHGLTVDGVVGKKSREALGWPEEEAAGSPAVAAVAVFPWLAIAEQEIGQCENHTPGEDNPRIVEYHQTVSLHATDDETPWCSSFVNWVLQQAGKSGTNSAAAKSWLNWGKASSQSVAGAVTILKRKQNGRDQATGSSSGYHVAFFVSRNDTHIRLLGGNQGDQVKYSNFPLSGYSLEGIREPV